jgi:hypothetical protein
VWQEEYESEANLSYIAIICLKKKEGTVKWNSLFCTIY